MPKTKSQQKNWQEIIFKDFVTLQRGFDLPKQNRLGGEYPVVASTSITDYHNDYKVEPPCVTTGRSGALGKVLYINQKCWPLNTTLWVKDFKDNNPSFVYYKLKTLGLEQFNSGSGVPTLNRNHLDQIKLFIPDFSTQKKISDVLSTYDELIENNTRRIQILEELAKEIYTEWFVYFRFLGHEKVKMVDSKTEFGKIPEEWAVTPLNQLVSTQYGYTESAQTEPVGPKYVRGTDINKTSYIDWSSVPYCKISDADKKKYKLSKGDIFVIRMADPGKVGIVEQEVDAVFASYLIRLEIADKKILPYYLFYFLNSDQYQNYIQGASGGTTRKSASAGVVTGTEILVPPKELVDKFEKEVSLFRTELNNLLAQNTKLRQVRDLLLPKLVTGEIEVRQTRPAKTKKGKEQPKKPIVSPFQDAVILANIVHQVSDNGFQPTRLRCAKLHYFVDRLSGVNPTEKYAVKEMGPYDVSSRYKGGERVAKNKQYIGQDKNKITTASNMQEALGYSYRQLQNIPNVLSVLKFKKDEQLEVLATVDYAVYDLVDKNHKKVTPKEIFNYISSNEVWNQKIERLKLTEDKIKEALSILKTLSQQGLTYPKP